MYINLIKLSVCDYCQKCNHFEADVEKPDVLYSSGDMFYYGDFIIKCKYRKICEDLLKIKAEEN